MDEIKELIALGIDPNEASKTVREDIETKIKCT